TRFSRDWSSDVCSSDLVNSGSELNDEFWQNVQTALNDGHVMVRFAVGEYMLTSTITVENMGHDENLLMLQAERSGSVIFEGEIRSEERRVGKRGSWRRR